METKAKEMKYTKGELHIEPGKNSNDTIAIYTGKEDTFDNIWIADIMGSHVGSTDDDERLGNAKLFIKAGKMHEALKEIIISVKNGVGISKRKINKIESILKE